MISYKNTFKGMTHADMTDALKAFRLEHNLPELSADELIIERLFSLTIEQTNWLAAFGDAWDEETRFSRWKASAQSITAKDNEWLADTGHERGIEHHDGSWIACTDDDPHLPYEVLIPTDNRKFANLPEAQQWLWDEWARDEN